MEYSLIHKEVLELTKAQFEQCRVQLNINKQVQVYEERTFEGLEDDYDKNTIYVLLHFELGTIMLGGTIQPIMLEVLSEENSHDIAYNLLLTYTQLFNYNIPTVESGAFVQQVYTTPTIQENFEQVAEGFRSLITSNGTIVYGSNISGITEITVQTSDMDNPEKVLFTSVVPVLQIAPNTANLGDNNSRARTLNRFGTFAITFNMVSQNTTFVGLCDGVLFGTTSINTPITVSITKNGTPYTKTLRFSDVSLEQQQGGIPTYTVGLVE